MFCNLRYCDRTARAAILQFSWYRHVNAGAIMGWIKDGERGYVDGDKRLRKHTCTFRIALGDPRLIISSTQSWQLSRTPAENDGVDGLAFDPKALKSTRHISATGTLDGRIRIIGKDGEEDWSTIDVALYRAEGQLKTISLGKPDIQTEPQVLWHDAADDEPKRPPALMLVLTLPPESFDLLERHLEGKTTAKVSMLAAIDIFEDAENYSWMSALNYRAYYIASGSHNGAMFEELLISPPVGASPGARERLIEAADEEIAGYIKEFCAQREIEENRYGQTGSLLTALCRAAADHDAKEGTSVEDFRDRTFRAVAALVDGLRDVATPWQQREKGKLDFWQRPRQPFVEIKRDKKAPELDRMRLEETADRYLRLPYRCPEFDRLLADMLAAVEIYAYGETVLAKNPVAWIFGLSASPLYPRPIRNWLIGQAWNTILFGIPIGIAWWLANIGWIEDDTAFWITLGSGGIFLLLLGISLIFLPLFIYRSHRERASTINRLQAMQTVYAAIQARGLVSARHVTRLVDASAAHDVVWPTELHVLLDDIVARGGRF